MRFDKWWTRGRKAVASATAIAIAVGVPLSMAVLHRGFPITDVDVTTRTVWVTNGEDILAGRLNRQIEELDAAVAAATPKLDVVQNGDDVFLFDTAAGSLERIDPAFTRLTERVDLPSEATVELGGTTLAILDQSKGKLWVVDIANSLDFDPVDVPVLELGKGAQVAVSPDGIVFASSPKDSTLYTIAGLGAKPVESPLEISESHEIAAIGNTFVVLDLDKNSLLRADGSAVDLAGESGMKLQQSGAENDVALVATGNSLLRVPLGNGSVEVGETTNPSPVTDPGSVSSPVWLDGCAHGAWSGSQQYVLWCDGGKPDVQPIEQPTKGSTLEFRVNKSVIALNNLDNGNVWLVDNEMRLVENWDEVTPPLEEETEEGDEKSSVQSFEDTLAERTETNRPPVAKEDEFGVRAGRTTILPVLENDSDPDGDVLTIENIGAVDEATGVLDLIDGGRALQFTPAAGASNAPFSYRVNDGRGGAADSFVTVRVVPSSENSAPVEKRTTSVGLEVGGTIDQNVLSDWIDPDGDDLTLIGASPVSGDEVRFTPDGFITFQSKTAELGEKEVRLTVSDGVLETTGTFIVDIAAPGSLSPIGTPDFAETFVNEPVVISPLANDLSLSTGQLALVSIDEVPTGLTATVNLDTNSVTASAIGAGTYYFLYSLSAGGTTSIGIVRVDVKPDPEQSLPPIAVKDTAYLRPGEPTLVKVLNNDVSPSGLVLAVQKTDTTATNASLTVEVLNNTTVRITSSAALTEQTQFTYTVSDGLLTALAGVTVVPVPPIINRQPPVAVADKVKVRAGDYVSVDVLDNDYHPDDSVIVLEPELSDDSNAGAGSLAFVNDQKLRYQAPTVAGDYSVVYRIADQFGESATATVTFSVTARDLKSNRAPIPEPQYARVYAGASVPITIPLDGIDPDGDSVVVSGVKVSPALGGLSEQTANAFVYTARETSAGTDEFRYLVEDIYGEQAIGVIYVGVIQRPDESEPPNAVDDSVEIRPGRTASVLVLENDSDPAGFPLGIDPVLPEVDPGIKAEVEDDKVVITAPEIEGAFTIRYKIDNGNGGVDTAFIHVKVTEDAEPSYPVAKDYYVTLDEVLKNDEVTVDLLDGLIANPGGRTKDLVISMSGPNADLGTVDQEAGTIAVRPSELRVAIAYTVTNEIDKLSTTAFIIVPPIVDANHAAPPYLDPEFGTQPMDMNGSGQWELDDIIIVPSGRKAIITSESTVKALSSNGESSYIDNNTVAFAPQTDFRGITTLTFEVTDGKNADDLNGNKAIISIAIMVGNPDFTDTPPTFTSQNVTIEAGEDATLVDLRASSNHPNPSLISQFEYSNLEGVTPVIIASISGGDLSVSAPRGSPVGTKTVLSFTVKFRDFTIPGSVTVTTVASTRPMPQAVQDDDKGRRGAAQPSFNVIDNDYNPFAATNEPLHLEGAEIENAVSGASLTWDPDGTVQVTPGSTFIGNVSVVYVLGDATGEKSREVQGRYILTVRDSPDKVSTPTAVAGDLQATVSWTAPATNGEPISEYTVTWTPAHGAGGGSATKSGNDSSHQITGLTNGTDYTFRVSATNLMGTSTVSDASSSVRPKGQATAPSTVTLAAATNGSGQLNMSWSGAGANGGDITGYRWTVYSGAQVATGDTTGATSAAWVGVIGTSYTFRVVALATGGDSVQSAASAAGIPQPGPPASVWASGATPSTINFNWTAPAQGGTDGYQYRINGGGWVATSATSMQQGGAQGQTFTIEVQSSKNGLWSAIASASGTTLNPNPRIVAISKGANIGTQGGVANATQLRLHSVDLGNGPYSVTIDYNKTGTWRAWDDGAYGSYTRTYVFNNGVADGTAWLGAANTGYLVRLRIPGRPVFEQYIW